MKTNTNSTTTIEAIVTRADGSIENLGIIAQTKKQGLFEIVKKKLKGAVKKWLML